MFIPGKQPEQPALGTSSGRHAQQEAMVAGEYELLEAVLESGPDVITIIAQDGTILRTFRSRDALFGFEPGEVNGRNLAEFVHPDDQATMEACMRRLLSQPNAASSTVLRVRGKSGQYLELECTGRNRLQDPVVGAIIVYSRDISERVALERRLESAERMEAVGRTASGLAHDFNNILTVIQLSASRALLGRGDEQQQLSQIQRAAMRASGLTKRLLSFARGHARSRSVVDVCQLIREMEDVLKGLLPDGVGLTMQLPETPRYVVAEAAQVEQVVLNLVLNARDALQAAGRQLEGGIHVSLRDGSGVGSESAQVILAVRDTGVGMDEATRSAAMEPFFTTRAASGGTGIGLWMVRDFAVRAGGTVTLHSEPRVGTLCEVSLPTVQQGAGVGPAESEPAQRLGRPATVLLVEDEPALRQTVAELLRDGGHRVSTARDGQEALEVATQCDSRIDLVITDVIMPRIGGVELVRALRQRFPELAVLFVSGCGDMTGAELPGATLLRKPFPAQALIDSVARLLGGGVAGPEGT